MVCSTFFEMYTKCTFMTYFLGVYPGEWFLIVFYLYYSTP